MKSLFSRLIFLPMMILSVLSLAACTAATTPAPSTTPAPAASPAPAAKPAQPYKLRMGAAPVGSGAYQAIVGHSQAFAKAPGVTVTVEETGGGNQNLDLIARSEIGYGVSVLNQAREAYLGVGQYAGKKNENIRLFTTLYFWPMQIVTLDKSSIKSVKDLAGKKVAVGPRGGGNTVAVGEMLSAVNMGFEKFSALYLNYEEAVDGIKNGNVDAVVVGTGVPTPVITQLAASHAIRIVPLTADEIKAITTKYGYYVGGEVPAKSYASIAAATPSVEAAGIVMLHKDVPDEVAYALTKALWENFEIVEKSHATQKGLTMAKAVAPLKDSGVPFHPGVAKYYREKGVIK